jgi:hypothetical protein
MLRHGESTKTNEKMKNCPCPSLLQLAHLPSERLSNEVMRVKMRLPFCKMSAKSDSLSMLSVVRCWCQGPFRLLATSRDAAEGGGVAMDPASSTKLEVVDFVK